MTQSKLAGLLKLITIGLGIIGACVYFLILPGIGQDWAAEEGYGGYFWPWLLFLWGTGIPCYVALFEFWGICTEIKRDNSFCEENAIRLKTISLLILGDVAYFFAGNLIFMALGMSHPGIVLLSLAVIALFALFYPRIFAVTFDESFSRATGTKTELFNTLLAVLTAITVVLGMRMMGALLISSLIIFPALSAMRICRSFKAVVLTAACISVLCFLTGLLASYFLETPTGASIVVADLLAYGICRLAGRK